MTPVIFYSIKIGNYKINNLIYIYITIFETGKMDGLIILYITIFEAGKMEG